MTGGVKIPISAEFSQADVQREVEKLTSQLNKIGQSIAQANRQKFNPIDKGAVEDMKRMQAQFESLQKINGNLRSRLKATGQEGRGFADVDWDRVYMDSPQRGRMMRGAYDYVTAGTSFGGRWADGPTPSGGGGGGRRPGPGGGSYQPAPDPAQYPGSNVVNAGLRAAGPVGGVVANGISAGLRGGMLAGAGAMVGGLAVLGVTKAIGAVKDKVGDAEQEAIGYDTLKRTLGDVNVSFQVLRDSLRQSAYQLNTSFEEAQRLGTEFGKLANIAGGGSRSIAGEVTVGGGLSRALGLGLGAGVGALGGARLFGVTSDEQGSRRLALMIGEAVGRVGFAKADEVLAAMGQFMSMQARAGMGAPNVAGYLGALSGLAGSGIPGLDAGGAASLLGRVNSVIGAGGGAGEAGQNFMFANVGRRLGLNPIQTRILLQQGAFGTGAGTFGSGSLYSRFASKLGGGVPGAAAGSSATNLEMIVGGLQRSYGGMGQDYLAAATANLLGLNESQAMALLTAGTGGGLGGIEKRLKAGGIPLSRLNATGIGALAAINTGGADVLQAQAESLRGRTGRDALTGDERRRLDAAMAGGNVETQRQVLTELTATREQEETEGKATRDSIESVGREIQKFATVLIPTANTMRDALVAMAAKIAPESSFGQAAQQAGAIRDRDLKWDSLSEDLKKFDAETESIQNSDRYKNMPANIQKKWMEERGRIREMKSNEVWRQFGDTGTAADALMSAVIGAESGGNHYGPDGQLLTSSAGARGITQVMPGTGRDPGFGVKPLQNDSPEEYRRFGRDYLAAMLRRYGGDKSRALGAYNWGAGNVDQAIGTYGDDWLKHAPAETQAYVSKILSGGSSATGAGAGSGGRGGATADEIHANLVLHPKTPDGKSAGQPVRVQVGRPSASGVPQ